MFEGKPNKIGLCDLCKIARENDKKMIINNCPTCNQKLKKVVGDGGVFKARFCDKCGKTWSIFELEYKREKKKVNLDKWIKI